MNEEQAFLDELHEHPEDDVTRLVYADWLEERGDGRAAYLRAEVALARMTEADEGYADAEAELAEIREDIVPQWLEQAGKRWDVVLQDYSEQHKIFTIKLVREALSYGLAEALVLVESAPSVIWVGTIRPRAEEVRRILTSQPRARIVLEIVPQTDPTKEYDYSLISRELTCKPFRWHPSP